MLVDRVGSELHLGLMGLRPEEIHEALVIFGLDPATLPAHPGWHMGP